MFLGDIMNTSFVFLLCWPVLCWKLRRIKNS